MSHQLHGAIGGNHLLPLQEVAVQQTADQSGSSDLEQNVPGAQRKGSIVIRIREDLFHFLQSRSGNHKCQRSAGADLRMVSPACQTEAVHRNGGNGLVFHFKTNAGVDGTGLIFRNGEDGAGDQALQGILRDLNAATLAHVGQFGVIIGRFCRNGKGCKTCTDGNLVAFVHHHSDRTLGQTADDITKQLGRQNALAGIGDFRRDLIGDGSFHVVTGQTQTHSSPAENAFNHRQAGLLSHRTAGNIQSGNQNIFFTGKTHG